MAHRFMPNLGLVFILCTGVYTVSCSSDKNSNASASNQLAQFDGIALLEPQFDDQLLKSLESTKPTRVTSLRIEITETSRRLEASKSLLNDVMAQISAFKTSLTEIIIKNNKSYDAELLKYDSNKNGVVTEKEILEVFIAADRTPLDESRSKIHTLESEISDLQFQIQNLSYRQLWFTSAKQELENKIATTNAELTEWKTKRSALVTALEQRAREEFERVQLIEKMMNDTTKTAKLDTLMREKAKVEQRISKLTARLSELQAQHSQESNISNRTELENELKSRKLQIAKRTLAKDKVSAKEIADVLIIKHFLAAKKGIAEYITVRERLNTLASTLTASPTNEWKLNYENLLAKLYFSEERLVYNRDAISTAHVLLNNRMQCYSGTTLFLTLSAISVAPHAHTVAIFTSGHVLPGYIEMVNNEPHLVGVETTAAGKALVQYGKTKAINGDIRVVDAHQFLFMELFKEDIKNIDSNLKIVQTTIEKYGFLPNALREFSPTENQTSDMLNASLFGFGQSNVPAGDTARESFDQKENLDYRIIEMPTGDVRFEQAPEYKNCADMNLSNLGHPEEAFNQACFHNDRLIAFYDYLRQLPQANEYSYSYTHQDSGPFQREKTTGHRSNPNCSLVKRGEKLDSFSVGFSAKANKRELDIRIQNEELNVTINAFIQNPANPLLTTQIAVSSIDIYALRHINQGKLSPSCSLQIEKKNLLLAERGPLGMTSGLHFQLTCAKIAQSYIDDFKAELSCVPDVILHNF